MNDFMRPARPAPSARVRFSIGFALLHLLATPNARADGSSSDSTGVSPGEVYALRSTSIDQAELHLYPADELIEFIDLQPGVVDGHLRGGRAAEAAFYYGRIALNNPVYNRPIIEIEPGMLSGIRVRPGIVDSRFGYGMSGLVLLDPRPVPATWTGRFTGRAAAFASNRQLEFLQRESDAANNLDVADFEVGRIPFDEAAEPLAGGDMHLRLGGPVAAGRLGLLANAHYRSRAGHMLGRRLFMPTDGIIAFSGRPRSEWIVRSSGDQQFVQLGSEDRLTLSGRAVLHVMPELDVSYDALYQNADRRPYDHSQKYVPDGTSRDHGRAQLHALGLTYGEGSDTRAWAHYAFMSDRRLTRLFDDPADERYANQGPGNGANAFDAGGNDLRRTRTRVKTHTASLAAAHRFLGVQEVRGGVEARIHDVQRREGQVEVLPNREIRMSTNPLLDNRISVTPSELSAFVGATVHIERFTIDAGLRSSYFDPAAEVPLDWVQASSAYIVNVPGSEIYDPEEGDTIRNRQDAPVKSWLSPRIELAFPVGDQTRIRFGAGKVYQMPRLQLLYANLEYEMSTVPTSPQSNILANPGLEPERTLHIEMGLEHRLADNLVLEVALFGKDVSNLVGYAYERNVLTNSLVGRPVNLDVAQVRGATLSLLATDDPNAILSWTLDYSLLFVEGNTSSEQDNFQRFLAGFDNVRSQEPLDWDRRHVIQNAVIWRPSSQLTFTVLNRLQSPLPYKMAVTNRPEYLVSGDDTPVQLLSDVRVWYEASIAGQRVGLFLQIDNLTDARIARSVLSSTGTAADLYETGRHLLLDHEVEGVNTVQEYADDRYYLPPRTLSLGLMLDF